nr:TniQ family protein [Kitasatospora purpeofusca]
MTYWTSQRIPIWVPPLAGEALDSWLAAYAARLATPMKPFLHYLGPPGANADLMVRRLTNGEQQGLSQRTGVAPMELTQFTLAPWDGLMFFIDPATRSLRRSPNALQSGRYPRYCPTCLGESGGRWQRRWRLAWTFACRRHHMLLLDVCPACQLPPVLYKRREVPRPGICLQGEGGHRCGFPLAQASTLDLAADGPVLLAQHHVNATILATQIDRGQALHRVGELALLARRVLVGLHTHLAEAPSKVRQIVDDAGGKLPAPLDRQDRPTALHTALGVTIASAALEQTPLTDQAVLPWIMRSHPPGESMYPVTWAHRWAKGSQQLAARAVAAVDGEVTLLTRLRYGTTTDSPSWPTLEPEAVEERAARIPSMLWPSWTARVLPRTGPMYRAAGLQRAAASLMLVTGSTCSYPRASVLLGNTKPPTNWQALSAFTDGQDSHVLLTTLVLLARSLDHHGAPIDYRRRRELFASGGIILDEDAVRRYCRRHGMMQNPSDKRMELCRWRIRKLLLGADPGTASRTPAWQRNTAHLVADELRTLLYRQARVNLQARGIDEPITWDPPAHWLPALDWPGFASEQIDRQAVADLMNTLPSLDDLSMATGVGSEHLRLYLEAVDAPAPTALAVATMRRPRRRAVYRRSFAQAPTPSGQIARRGGSPIPRQGVLAPEELRRLYIDERLSTPKIAKLAGCTSSTVGRFLKEAGIPTRRREGPMLTAQGSPVTAEWLRREYVELGRDTPDIALELGCHTAQVSHLMKRFGIPARALFATTNRFARLQIPLSPAMSAVSTMRNHIQRMRIILQLPGHHDLAAAIRALNVPDSSLRYQLNAIEEAVGFRIIERIHPLTPTVQGQEFLAEAQRLIRLLDTDP